ncbi:hypothetical protein BGX24_011709 [Mortierella sp. AD032]|nr:hypothetical protein BGX24_011709 [Mortierella sp. AD032]
MVISWKRSLLATAACLASIASLAQAVTTCGSPNTAGQVVKPGDFLSLYILVDNSAPTLDQVNSLSATLYCSNTGKPIESVQINPPNVPFTYTVPPVGNISTPAGTDGPCLGNRFYVAYSGTTPSLIGNKFGPISCPDMTITPGAYVPPVTIPPTNPPTSSVPTIPTTSKKPPGSTTTTASTSTIPLPTETKTEDGGGGLKISTPMIVVIALAVVLILALMIVAICFRVRRQKRKRMEDAIMPWSTKPNNSQFSKMPSSMEEDRPSSSGGGGSAGAAAAAELSGSASKTTMPKPPQLHASGKGYYGEDSYAGAGYGQQPNLRHPHGAYLENPQDGYNNQRQPHGEYFEGQKGYNIPQNGYNNPQEDYHNPYYAQQEGGAGGGYQGSGNPAAGYGYATPDGPQGHYPSHPGDHAFYESHDQYPGSAPQALPPGEGRRRRRGEGGGSRRKAGNGGNGEAAAVAAAAAGYYPPPPPVRGPTALALRGPTSLAPPTPNYGQLDTTELILPGAVSAPVSSGNARAPQEMPELKPKSTGADAANVEIIPMKQLPSAPHV